jgi:hypothetical protein
MRRASTCDSRDNPFRDFIRTARTRSRSTRREPLRRGFKPGSRSPGCPVDSAIVGAPQSVGSRSVRTQPLTAPTLSEAPVYKKSRLLLRCVGLFRLFGRRDLNLNGVRVVGLCGAYRDHFKNCRSRRASGRFASLAFRKALEAPYQWFISLLADRSPDRPG